MNAVQTDWHSESDEPAPAQFTEVDDRLTADEALKRVRRGEYLWYRGDFHNARTLLQAMARRLLPPGTKASLAETFRHQRQVRQREFETLSRVVVELGVDGQLALRRSPDTRATCEYIWGTSTFERPKRLALKTLVGMISATEFRRTGLPVPGLKVPLVPHWGVYVPTRFEYLEPLTQLTGVKGATVFDIGTGTGVLSWLLLQQGAAQVVATDIEPRAIACAQQNAVRQGFASRFTALQREGWPEGQAQLAVCNPPWLPETPKNRFDRAVFDADSAMVSMFLQGLRSHLHPHGRGVLLISNLAELLGLRPRDWLSEHFAQWGLSAAQQIDARPTHARTRDRSDPLHEARSREVTSMYVLTVND